MDGVIVGRNLWIKGWLRDNIPEVYGKYTTAMRYKAAAKKLKQEVELADPTPADVVLPQRLPADGEGEGVCEIALTVSHRPYHKVLTLALSRRDPKGPRLMLLCAGRAI